MTRSTVPYSKREVRPVHVAGAVDVSTPVAGFYRTRLGKDTVRVGVRLWWGPPNDPVTGEPLDRSYRWQADVNGEPYPDFDRLWPVCAAEPISEADYRRMCARQDWARQHAPDSPYAEVGRKLDPLSTATPLPF